MIQRKPVTSDSKARGGSRISGREDSEVVEYRTHYGISQDPCSAGGEIPALAAGERRCWAVAVPVFLLPSIFFPAGPER